MSAHADFGENWTLLMVTLHEELHTFVIPHSYWIYNWERFCSAWFSSWGQRHSWKWK